jgi:hypothetical protein
MSGARPARVRGAPARFDEEQAARALLSAAAAGAAPRSSALYEVEEVSSEEEEEEEEEKAGEHSAVVAEINTWSREYSPFTPHRFHFLLIAIHHWISFVFSCMHPFWQTSCSAPTHMQKLRVTQWRGRRMLIRLQLLLQQIGTPPQKRKLLLYGDACCTWALCV